MSEFAIGLTSAEQAGIEQLGRRPDLNVRILYSRHHRGLDLGPEGSFRSELETTDLYLPERAPNLSEALYQAVADGSRIARVWGKYGLTWSDFSRRTLDDLYGSNVKVWITDPAYSEPLMREIKTWKRKAWPRIKSNDDPSNEAVEQWGALENKREWLMLARLGARLHQGENMDLQRVLMTLGTAHTGVFHKLRSLGVSTERVFPSGKVNFPPIAAAVRAVTLRPASPQLGTEKEVR